MEEKSSTKKLKRTMNIEINIIFAITLPNIKVTSRSIWKQCMKGRSPTSAQFAIKVFQKDII